MNASARDLLDRHGIKLTSYAPGRHYTTCPQCSAKRSNAHRNGKVLGVTIEGDSARWGCNHCSWSGPPKGGGGGKRRGELPSYVYRDAAGTARFRKVRNLPGREPRFWLEQPDGKGGWRKGTKGVNTKIIYRANEVAAAIAAARIIAVVEGEKDADNVTALGFVATCNAHGASEPGKQAKWTKAHSEQLAGADIVVLNDNDAAGYEHADVSCKLSFGIAQRVRRLDLAPHWPDIPKGGDISDWLALGHTGDELRALIESAPDYESKEQPQEQAKAESPANGEATDIEITRLAKLATMQYEQERKAAADKLKVRASILDRLVRDERSRLGLDGGDDKLQGTAVTFDEIEPWPELVDGAQLLDDLVATFGKHVIMLEHEREICALWTVHTYLIKRFKISPKLSIKSAVKECGKTTVLEILDHLVFRPWMTGSITPAALFRVIEKWHPTLLVDEVDSFVGDNEELRGMLNGSHRYDGAVTRTVGDEHEARKFSTYAAVALSGIGGLADTLADRSVTVALRRRRANEVITQLRIGRTEHLGKLRQRIARWIADHEESIAKRDPAMPASVINREADNWHVLLAVSDEVGGAWPERARKAAEQHHIAVAGDDASLLELLLGDVRDVFDGLRTDVDRISSAHLIERLIQITPRPWAEYGRTGKPLSQNGLARLLRPLKPAIASQNIRIGHDTPKGYYRHQFTDAWECFLSQEGVPQPPHRHNADEMGTSEPFQSATADPGVAVGKCEKSNNDGPCGGVADGKGKNGDARVCAHCGRPGGNEVALGDDTGAFRLHRECERAFLDQRAA